MTYDALSSMEIIVKVVIRNDFSTWLGPVMELAEFSTAPSIVSGAATTSGIRHPIDVASFGGLTLT